MTLRCLRAALMAGAVLVPIDGAISPARAQWIVFDPTNYSQNVLTAARALEEVNNQILSLENEAKMLANQAKNLASLPYSSLAQLQGSISQTEQLLSQAQRISYSIGAIDQAFRQVYPQSYSGSTSSTQLLAGAQTRWQNSLSGFQDAMRAKRASSRTSMRPVRRSMRSSPRANPRPARCKPPSPETSSSDSKRPSSRI